MKLFKKSKERIAKINEIIGDLKTLKNVKDREINQYAIDENIRFFESTKSVFRYIWWILFHAPKIDGKRLLEITDFGVEKWDKEMHTKLIKMERKEFPGLIEPLVKKIFSFVENSDEIRKIASLGAGGMEVERQIIERLINIGHKQRVVFIGIDRSETVQQVALENLGNFGRDVVVKRIEFVDEDIINKEINNSKDAQYIVILCKNDIFELDKNFSQNYFDIVFHTLFKHHLDDEEKTNIDIISNKIANNILEYDGYRSWIEMIPQTIVGWNNQIFLNAEIFSNLRFAKKRTIRKNNIENQHKLSFYPLGYYIKEHNW